MQEGAAFHFRTTLVHCVKMIPFVKFVLVEEGPRFNLKFVGEVCSD